MSEIRPQGRELIAAARHERTPSARDRERVFAAMMAGAALTTASTAAAAPSLFAKLTGGAAKWWLLGGFCATVAGGGYLLTPARVTAVAPSPPRPPAAEVASSEAPVTVEPRAAALPSAPASPNVTRPGPAKRENARPDLELELSELHAAHAAYRSARPEQALALIAQHKRRFPQSQLGVERTTLEVLSLCRLGRQTQALKLADRLRVAAPDSAALSGLEGSCAAAAAK
jgi:hypothetical protein